MHRGYSFSGFITLKDDPDAPFYPVLPSHIYLNIFSLKQIKTQVDIRINLIDSLLGRQST